MTDLSSKTALVVDQGGLFTPLAHRLARDGFGRVLYYEPWEEGFSKIYRAITGDGYADIERCDDIWEVKDQVDCFCYDDQTEILSENGWKLFKELKSGERVATLNPATDNLEYHVPDEYIAYHYSGPMIQMETCRVNFCVTPNHRMYVRRQHLPHFELISVGKIKGRTNIEFCKSALWVGNAVCEVQIPECVATWRCGNPTVQRRKAWPSVRLEGDVFMALAGFYLAEGSLERRNGKRVCGVSFGQNSGETWHRFVSILKSTGLPCSFKKRKNGFNVAVINSVQIARFFEQLGEGIEKRIPKWIKEASSCSLKVLFDWYMLGDGSKTGRTCSTVSKQLAHDLQEVILKIGFSASEKPIKSKWFKAPNGRTYLSRDGYRINISKSYNTPIIQGNRWNSVPYDGTVFCVSVPNHVVYVRRRGVPIWCGNCFPDVGMAGLQLELESQGRRVWGSRNGSRLELDRPLFLRTLAELGLDVPKHEIVKGLDRLREYLLEHEDVYIKISKYRGMLETCHWRSWDQDKWLLDAWAVKFGPIGDRFPFLVFDSIDTPLEIGGDTYCVDGQWPRLMLNGIEAKDKGYFAAVTKREEMPDEVLDILKAFGPVLAEDRYRNEFSIEARVTDTEVFFIDPTCRGGLPSTGSQLELWSNFPQIVWHGAGGELIDPEPAAQFSMECILTMKGSPGNWCVADVPEELQNAMKLAGCCEINGQTCFPPDEEQDRPIGWLVAVGDTPEETLAELKRLAEMVPDGVTANVEALAEVIKEVHMAQADDIPFTDKPVPEPAEVLET